MKRYLIFIVALLATTFAFGQRESICVVISGSDNFGKDNVMTMETDFMNYLRDQYRVRIGKSSDLFKARADELRFQQTGSVDPEQVKEFGKFMGVDLLCVVSAVKSSDNVGSHSFRSAVFTVENGEIREISKYPDIYESDDDKEIIILNDNILQRVDGNLLLRLNILNDNSRNKIQSGLSKAIQIDIDNIKEMKDKKNKANLSALGLSIIPGLGLIQKGHKGEGITYLIGDIALVGAGIGFSSNASSQKKIMNDVNTGIDEYNKAKSKYDSSRNASYICFGAAGAVYVVNLIRSYVATPKSNARINWNIPSITVGIDNDFAPSMGVSIAMTYSF